ncbi:pro-neuregulin-1, membrane-bound isoform-like isoform X5 [Myxocyprinus asiaticus]|uniref:pro-neuregulin-1, membrane-bound isoform-like isoform X5 n=1 Tax=Myxocyprinus asiaticus TaxID=70543 RepID=UPI002221B11B|nr:pro-neuregulin-1, membrane-bound isoform-like isoform X5 [Myxocyprinus asiaticus]
MKSEAAEDISAGLASQASECLEPPSDVLSEVVTKETPEEEEEDTAGDGDGSKRGPQGCVPLPAVACCVCLELERVRNCIRSEKICILPILACLLSLALCTAGLKWVIVDKIFEYEPPTHLDLKRIGQDLLIDSDPTQNTLSKSPPTLTTLSIPGLPKVFVEGESTAGPFKPSSSKVSIFTPTAEVTTRAKPVSTLSPKSTFKPAKNDSQYPSQTLESNELIARTSATSTTPAAKTSSHVTRCSESESNYCVNGGKCFTLEVTPGNIRRLCRCPDEFTGERCQNYIMASFYKHLGIEFMAEELYQKRVLTITGICIALLVVGIMCVVAYCKTKKQRKKLHDRLRQSLRERNAAAKSPQHPHPPPENLQLDNHYMPNNVIPPHVHVMDKEAETSLSINELTSSTHPSVAVPHSNSQCWSNRQTDSMGSDSHAVLVKSSQENCQHGTPSHRGRLNATGGVHQLHDYLKSSCRDSPYSERYVSAMTTPTRLSPMGLLSPVTPSSPPSEMSAPLSSLATSVPSMATSPSGEEERPLLFRTPPILCEKNQVQKSGHSNPLHNSAHYNHGLDLPSPPPSPQHITEDEEDESLPRCTIAAAALSLPPHSPVHQSNRTQMEPTSISNSESFSSESETEDERDGEDTPFLGLQNPLAATTNVVLDGLEGNRTNSVLHLSPQDDLQCRLSTVMANQDPIAV